MLFGQLFDVSGLWHIVDTKQLSVFKRLAKSPISAFRHTGIYFYSRKIIRWPKSEKKKCRRGSGPDKRVVRTERAHHSKVWSEFTGRQRV